MMMEIVKVCKKHGELEEKDVRIYFLKGYKCKQCKICNREYNRKRTSTEKRKEYEKNRKSSPLYKEKQKIYENKYKERRRMLNRELYHKKKNDPDYIDKTKKWRNNSYQKSKDAMSDSYIKKILRIYKNATPEMIENKRKEILEFRKLKEELKLRKQQKKDLIRQTKENNNQKKLNGIVKTCFKHGDLTKNDAYLIKNGKKAINKLWFCKLCKNDYGKKKYEKYKDVIKIKQKIYIKNNKEKIRKKQKEWLEKAPDCYVAKYFTNIGIPKEMLTPDIIDLKRKQLLLKRKIKEKKKCQN